uniref:Putative leucine rich repeat-containing protein n=1 Tax=Ixodes ricinus TaxID=34613 RepID=A0A0K8RBM3_IXORI
MMFDELTEQLFGDVFKQNRTIETFLLNDYTGQFELSDHKPLIKLDRLTLTDNYVVTKVKNKFSGVPWEGLSAVHTILRRNWSLLNRAVRFALDPTPDLPEVADLFWQVRHLLSFRHLLARVVNTTAKEAEDKISVVENFVKCHYGK